MTLLLKNNFINHFKLREDNLKLSSLFYICLHCILLLASIFIGWNYFGLAFFYFLFFFFKHCDSAKNLNSKDFLINSIILLAIWHLGAIFWMTKIDYGFAGLVINLIFYLVPLMIFYFLRNFTKHNLFLIIPIWILTEQLIDLSDFSFPWLIIGNCLSNSLYLAQFYEYIGVLGGSFFMLIISLLFYQKKYVLVSIVTFLVAILNIIATNTSKNSDENKIISQKYLAFNSEDYFQKINYVNNEELAFYIKEKISKYKIDAVVLTEQSFRGINYKYFKTDLTYKYLNELVKKQNTKFIYTGITSVLEKQCLTNSMLVIDKNQQLIKIKNKLVPYTEYIPQIFGKYLHKFNFSYLKNDSLVKIKSKTAVLPLICYESIYSHYVSNQSQNSNLICLITSEKFLNNSELGKKQYNNIISLRAIENRLPIIKAASCGTSFFMNKNGKIVQESNKEINVFDVKTESLQQGTFYNNYSNKFHLVLILTFFITFFYYLPMKVKS